MSLVKWSPTLELQNLSRVMDDAFSGLPFGPMGNQFRGQMPMDMWEDEDQIIIVTQVPGAKEDQIDISVDNNMLTIKVQNRQESEKKDVDGSVISQEIYRGEMTRQMSLPTNVEADKCEAKLKDGELTLSFPKKEEAKPKRISIKSS